MSDKILAPSDMAEVIAMRKEIARLRSLLFVAECPDPNCEDGIIPVYNETLEGGALVHEVSTGQCQWCDERKQALKGADDDPQT